LAAARKAAELEAKGRKIERVEPAARSKWKQ
jgi:hypothetical protein